jgi:hypothetical protein
LLSIKNIFLINLDYKKIINDFTTKNVKKKWYLNNFKDYFFFMTKNYKMSFS